MVPEQLPIIILDRKSAVCMSKNRKDTRHTRKISRRMPFVRNYEEWNLHKPVWCEGGLELADIGTNKVRGDELNNTLGYDRVRIDNWQNICTRGVIGYRTIWRTMWYEQLVWIELRIQLNDFEMFIWVYNDGNSIENCYRKQCENSVKKIMYK